MQDDKVIAAEVIKEIERIKRELDTGLESKDYAILEEKVKTSSEILEELSLYCKEIVSPDRVVSMSVNLFLKDCISTWKKKFWSVEIIGKSEGSLEIECSKLRLKKAFENLILNSMEAGASEIIVTVTKNGISFQDDGNGISPMDSERIRAEGTTKGKGRGLGLKMIKGFLSTIGWRFELKNNDDGGLTVNFLKGES